MSFNVYYQEELLALRELGREFSYQNPALAPFLDTPGRDPDVERILEGFAFLAGRLRQKLDDELPEITHSLFNLLWPNYLRPIPSASILRYTPGKNTSGALLVPRGTAVSSVPVQGTPCQFRTIYDTEIQPLAIQDQHIRELGGSVCQALRLVPLGVPLENLQLAQLRFFIAGETAIAHTIYFSMVARCKELRVALFDAQGNECHAMTLDAQKHIRAMGFQDQEALYPYPANTFPGYRILQEYFCFPEKFLFVEITGLDRIFNQAVFSGLADAASFELQFIMDALPDQYESFRTDNWQLFCTPVVNIFPMDATPLLMDHRRPEYRIVPDPRNPYSYAVYSVTRAGTWGHDDRNSCRYLPFESFEHDTRDDAQNIAYYRLRLRPSPHDNCPEAYISIMHAADGKKLPQTETISLELLCTNRNLPQALRQGDICQQADTTSGTVSHTNITPVTRPLNPPLDGDLLWRLLSNMSLNYVSLTSIHALRAMLTSYDFRAFHDRQQARILEKLLDGIVQVKSQASDRICNGLPVRGAKTTLRIDQNAFCSEGAMYLFGSVLNEFFALCATVNSFHQLCLEEVSRGERYVWPARLGRVTL